MASHRILATGGLILIVALAILLTDGTRPKLTEKSPTGERREPARMASVGIARTTLPDRIPRTKPMFIEVVAPIAEPGAPAADKPPPRPSGQTGLKAGVANPTKPTKPTDRRVPERRVPVRRVTTEPTEDSGEQDLLPGHRWPLDRDGIKSAMREWMPELQECYEAWLEARSDESALEGKLVAKFDIVPDDEGVGRVTAVKLGSSGPRHAELESCVLNVASSLQFQMERGQKGVRVTYPVNFSPKQQ